MLCVPIEGRTVSELNERLQQIPEEVTMVEVRADTLNGSEFPRLLSLQVPPRITTVCSLRRRTDGGAWQDSESDRITRLRELLQQQFFSYVLWEEDSSEAAPESASVMMAYTQLQPDALPATWSKVVLNPQSDEDFLQTLQILQGVSSPLLVETDGPHAFTLAAMLPFLGKFCSCLPPASVISMEHFIYHYRHASLEATTAIFGLAGYPLKHTLSPAFHNSVFHQQRVNAIYLPFSFRSMSAFMRLVTRLPVKGFSLTVPHKQAILPYLSSQSTAVTRCGACNTVLQDADGRLHGYNTDLESFLHPLNPYLRSDLKVVVIGAGGAARAVLGGLYEQVSAIWVLNRSQERAQKLCEDFRNSGKALIQYGLLSQMADVEAPDLIVQATTVGMFPDMGDPIPFYNFRGSEIVYDLIYNPPETMILQRAAQAGCVTINGQQMFEAQAEMQSKLFLTVKSTGYMIHHSESPEYYQPPPE